MSVFAVNFAFAMAALHLGRLDAPWPTGAALGARPWVFLTAGIVLVLVGLLRARLGRLVVLGSGENASLLPWLLGTALLRPGGWVKRGAYGHAVLLPPSLPFR